ncbi:MAG: hypothetical protein VYE68_01305 [Acidobacteriota bacterium]|nr:hypothetical protein [Acidobacteriota bacterium]
MLWLAVLSVVSTLLLGVLWVRATLRARRRDAQLLSLCATFGPPIERAQSDPRVLLAWYPVACAMRRQFAEAFAALSADPSKPFPWSPADIEAAHARWTADWLEWERHQDVEHRTMTADIETKLERAEATTIPGLKTRLEHLEQQKLEHYQRRYEEYVGVSRALKKLAELASSSGGDDTIPSGA